LPRFAEKGGAKKNGAAKQPTPCHISPFQESLIVQALLKKQKATFSVFAARRFLFAEN
jgi:hypothetical protein